MHVVCSSWWQVIDRLLNLLNIAFPPCFTAVVYFHLLSFKLEGVSLLECHSGFVHTQDNVEYAHPHVAVLRAACLKVKHSVLGDHLELLLTSLEAGSDLTGLKVFGGVLFLPLFLDLENALLKLNLQVPSVLVPKAHHILGLDLLDHLAITTAVFKVNRGREIWFKL